MPETKTLTSKSFTIVDEKNIGVLNIVRHYGTVYYRHELKSGDFFLHTETFAVQDSRFVKIR